MSRSSRLSRAAILERRVLSVFVLGFAIVAGAASAGDRPEIAMEIAGDRSEVSWSGVPGHRLTLSISGPRGFVHRQEFSAGAGPRFGVFAESGDYRAAGSYVWEIVASPATKGRRVSRRAADGAAAPPVGRGFTRSGSFTIVGGELVDPVLEEPIAAQEGASAAGGPASQPFALKDHVISDDLIVDGSTCVGFACINGESFGADTLRLKEHNLRIHFQDTSTASSFPTNDWRITVNSEDNGGLSKFSIDDIDGGATPFTVEAGAPSHSLYVDDRGHVGLGTATPLWDIHAVSGNSPALRLEQNGSVGFDPQTWDVVGNEYSFFIRDATNGSTLPFRIEPGASSNALVITSDDEIGIGAGSNPAARLHVGNTPSTDADDFVVTATGAVGIGTATPAGALHIASQQGSGRLRFDDGDVWELGGANSSSFIIDTGGGGAEVMINASGTMVLSGGLITGSGGACSGVPCDGTFTDYELESIEEHAAYMWRHSHLWGVGPTPEGAPMNLTLKTAGILHELEKAHIYIEQLNNRVKELEALLTPAAE